MEQNYSKYSEQDQEVWNILYERQIVELNKVASSKWLNGLNIINFSNEEIPKFNNINNILKTKTGWEIECVPSIVDDDVFFKLLSNKKFPATSWLRKKEQLDYLEQPDMFHDVFAHLPLLTNKHFVNFLEELGDIALNYIDNKYTVYLISKIYWYTVEFGLIREDGEIKIYGAGLLSSFSESKYCLSENANHKEFNIEDIFNSGYEKDKYQSIYYIIESYEQLYNSLDSIKTYLYNNE